MHKKYVSKVAFLCLAAGLGGCEGDGGSEDVVVFDQPQIVPQSNVLCLSYDEVVAGSRSEHFVQLINRGRDPLIIRGATVEDATRNSVIVDRVRAIPGNVDCTEQAPCTVRTGDEAAVLRFFYEPPAPGWDTANLRILSNAQNYPMLRLFVLARARPEGLDAGVSFDAGPKPSDAVGSDGSESCPEME